MKKEGRPRGGLKVLFLFITDTTRSGGDSGAADSRRSSDDGNRGDDGSRSSDDGSSDDDGRTKLRLERYC